MIKIHKPRIETVNGAVFLKSRIVDSAQNIDTDIWYQTSEKWGGAIY